MTIGTAIVASTKVRRTGVNVLSQPPRARFRTGRVGKTASQIIRASWWRVGGPAAAGREFGRGSRALMGAPGGCRGSGRVALGDGGDGVGGGGGVDGGGEGGFGG